MDYHRIGDELHDLLGAFFSARKDAVDTVIQVMSDRLAEGGKILVFGNGGSASQSQHFAAELVNKFQKPRPALRAVALTTDTSALTSIANDVDYAHAFSRQVEALGDAGDVALGLSTSGNSPSVLQGLETARARGLITMAMTGAGGGKAAPLSDHLLDVPSRSTPRIQEVHLLLLHVITQGIEDRLFKE